MKEIILKESTASSKRPTGIILNVDSAVAGRIDSGSKMTIRCGTKNVIRINTPRKKPFELELAEWEQMTLDLYRVMSSSRTQARHVTTIGTCCRMVPKKEAKQHRPISLSDFAEQEDTSKGGVPPVNRGKEPSLESTFRRERVTSSDDQRVERKVSSKTEFSSAQTTGGITEIPVASRPKARSKTRELAPEIHRERTVSSEGSKTRNLAPELHRKRTLSSEGSKTRNLAPETQRTVSSEGSKTRNLAPETQQTVSSEGSKTRNLAPEIHRERTVSSEGSKIRSLAPELHRKRTLSSEGSKTRNLAPETQRTVSSEGSKTRNLAPGIHRERTVSSEGCKTRNLAPEVHRERTASSEGHVVKRKVPSDAEGRSKERKASARTKAAPSSSSLKQSIKDVPGIVIQRTTSMEAQTTKRKVSPNVASNSRANRLTGGVKSSGPSVNSAPPSGTPESTPERVINLELVKLSERPAVKRKASATSESRHKEKKLGKLVPSSCSPDPSPKMRKLSSNTSSGAHKPIPASSNSSPPWQKMSIPELKAYTQKLQQKADEVEHELNTLCARDEEFQSRLDEIMLSDAALQYDELGEMFPEMKEPDALFERWDNCLARREALASEGEAIKVFLMERNRKMRARIGI
ncbi:hypothetical protein, variant [Spizellomyces punctatus DAOM BR117]|uniref:Uncharacterized protein n=1 Tax=Spizellomyces punctatus (strain DAOM BR117) TaxID=645134 RepID=A0A0L0HNA5_SPIPD|nr:hypothetical protein, variant [Spizellomyces punctatus DAOM BR117]KND02425.1 hypothetical protein, variant [Spizellomyces punctatus DAOM BR117]|eukprot:XP_016610464.1 hypothetical protein, variant [Spizellomyces punctatus DAOM BR117]